MYTLTTITYSAKYNNMLDNPQNVQTGESMCETKNK